MRTKHNSISLKMVDAIKVQFLKSFFEDDFPEKGMKAWLTNITWESREDCYKLFFDFEEFEKENKKYFIAEYYSNIHTKELEKSGRTLFTALEAGYYEPKYSVYFSLSKPGRNDALFTQEILQYLRVVK